MSSGTLSNLLTYRLERTGPTAVLALEGEADMVAVPSLRKLLRELTGTPLLVVDLAAVTFLNTLCWGALQLFQVEAPAPSRMVLCGLNDTLRVAYEINCVGEEGGASGQIQVFATRAEAQARAGTA